MKIALIKFKNIGDTLLLTPTIKAIKTKYPESEICLAVREGTESILAGCAGIDHIITSKSPHDRSFSIIQAAGSISRFLYFIWQKFDYCLELGDNSRGRWWAIFCQAKRKITNVKYDFPPALKRFFNGRSMYDYAPAHRVEKDFNTVSEFLPLEEPIPPLQYLESRIDSGFVRELPYSNFLIVHPTSRWKRKQWPLERWILLFQRLLSTGYPILLSSGPGREERDFCLKIQSFMNKKVDFTGGYLNWAQLAGLFYRARLFIGVDTAAMHLAAACALPTVALFGPSVERAWHPWAVENRVVVPFVDDSLITRIDGYVDVRLRKMDQISVDQVYAACLELLAKSKATDINT